MHPHLNSAGSDAEYIDKWQQVVREYERISGKELGQTVKTATLMEEAPPQPQEHLQLRSQELEKVILAIEGYVRSKKAWDSGGPVDMDIGSNNKGKGQPQGKGKGKGQPKGKGNAKGKNHEPKNNENSKSDRKCFVCDKPGHFAKGCDHRVRSVNEVTKTAFVSTPVSVITEPGHLLSHVFNQNTSVGHDWIFALTVDSHSCCHYTASSMKLMVDSGAAIHVCPSWCGFSPLCASAKQLSRKSAGGDVLHHLGSKVERSASRVWC